MNNDDIKVYVFYLTTDDEVYGIQPMEIYAYTTSKKDAMRFKKSRSPDKLCMKKLILDSTQVNELYKEHMLQQIESVEAYTRYSDSIKKHCFKIMLTKEERMVCDREASVYLHEYIYRNVWTTPYVFKNKYIKALTRLLYSGFHYFICGRDDIAMKTAEKVVPNTMSILLDNFGELFDERGDNN